MRTDQGLVLAVVTLLTCSILCPSSVAVSPGEAKSPPSPSVSWHYVADVPCQYRMGAGVAVFHDKLWAIGGYDDNFHPLNDIWSSPDGVHWTEAVQHAPWPDNGDFAVVFHDKLWLLGCNNGDGTRGAIWSSPDGISWTKEVSSTPWEGGSGRGSYSVAVFQDKLWVIGGVVILGDKLNDVWASPDGVNWNRVVEHAPWEARGGAAAAVFDNRLWITGGVRPRRL